jgi:hypothetical protein
MYHIVYRIEYIRQTKTKKKKKKKKNLFLNLVFQYFVKNLFIDY